MENYLKDIQDIKKMMDRSSQFLSLSGLSGVMAGIYALAGAYAVKQVSSFGSNEYSAGRITIESYTFKLILLIAAAVLALSLTTAAILTFWKAKKDGETVWNSTSKRLAINFLIPLCTGGIFAVLLIQNRYYGLI